MRFRWIFLGFVLVSTAAHAQNLEVTKPPQWGFDGSVVLHEFNPLFIYVENQDTKPFRGVVTLQRRSGILSIGAQLVSEEFYLAPNSARWMTYYPYISDYSAADGPWILSWGRGMNQHVKLDSPKVVDGSVVYLLVNDTDPRPRGVKFFDAIRFPLTAGATNGLRAVFMDQAPNWDTPRRKAFHDWLYAGGELHLLNNPGRPLAFKGSLSFLNEAKGSMRYGLGKIVRHHWSVVDLNVSKLKQLELTPTQITPLTHPMRVNFEHALFQRMTQIVRPKHHWGLIYIATITFLLIVGPLNAWLSRRRIGYRTSLGIVCLSVLLFGYAFYEIGQRGYDSRTVVHSLAYAHPVSDGWSVTQYVNIFVTRGDRYHISHDTPQNLYSTAEQNESVPGVIRPLRQSGFDVTIPIYSSQSLLHRSVIKGDSMPLEVEQWPAAPVGFDGFVVRSEDRISQDWLQVIAIRGDRICQLRRNTDGVWTPSPWESRNIAGNQDPDRINLKQIRNLLNRHDVFRRVENRQPTLDQLIVPTIANHMRMLQEENFPTQIDSDVIHLFIYTYAPEILRTKITQDQKESQYIIYRIDLRKEAIEPEVAGGDG